MKKNLIIYSTTDGQTLLICKKIKEILTENAEVSLVALPKCGANDLENYDQIILGASIRYGKHKPSVHKFVELNRKILQEKKTAFFTVNVVARKPNKNSPETNPYLKKFLDATVWEPDILGVFAGKIDYPKYGFFDRHVIRFIMYMTKGPTDINGTYEFTDWEKVEEFANKINQLA